MENFQTTNEAVTVHDLEISFDGQPVIRNFSLRLAKGEKVLVMGPSGSGKSTLLLCLMGFIKPQKGTISIDGQNLSDDNVWHLRRKMVWVAQEPDLGKGTVRNVIELPFSYKANHQSKSNLTRLDEYMLRFGLKETLLDKDVSTLSGGEKQRIALITALLLEREIILLDEPSSALDAASKQSVMDFLTRSKGLSILAVSHDRDWASCVDRVEMMEHIQRTPNE